MAQQLAKGFRYLDEDVHATKKSKPSLVVQTNVSRHRGQVPVLKTVSRGDRRSSTGTKASTSSRVFVSRDDVERRLSMKRRRQPVQPQKQPAIRYLKSQRASPVSRSSRSTSVTTSDYLSPSEGGIFIGLQVPSRRLGDFGNRNQSQLQTKTELSPATPSIVVTPADDEYTPSRYSATSFRHDSFMPPLPEGNALEEQREKFFREMQANRASAMTVATMITNSPMTASAEPWTAATVSSTGWWNLVLSPTGTIAPPLPATEMSEKIGSPSLTIGIKSENRDSAWTDALDWDSPLTAYTSHEPLPDVPMPVMTPPDAFPPSFYSLRGLPSQPTTAYPSLPSQPGPKKEHPPSFYPQRQPPVPAQAQAPAAPTPPAAVEIKFVPLPARPSPKQAAEPLEKGKLPAKHVDQIVYQTITINSRTDSLPAYSKSYDVASLDRKAPLAKGSSSKPQPPPRIPSPTHESDSEDDFFYVDEKTPILERAAAVGVSSRGRAKGKEVATVSSPQPPPYSSPKPKAMTRNIQAVLPSQEPPSPAPITPSVVSALESSRNFALKELPREPSLEQSSFPQPAHPITISAIDSQAQSKMQAKIEKKRQRKEKREALMNRLTNCWRGRGPFSNDPRSKKKMRLWIWLALLIIILVTTITVIAVTLARKARAAHKPVIQRMSNVTVVPFPTIPNDDFIISLTQMQAVSSCINPSSMWSCGSPPTTSRPANRPQNQPDFRFRISMFGATSRLFARDGPQPPQPPLAEREFLGRTTDNILGPQYGGRETPFTISFVYPNITKRDLFTTPNTDAPVFGTGALPTPPNLLPTSGFTNQPLMLFNENTTEEHYGFYNYFDRSQFLSGLQPNLEESNDGGVPPGQSTRQLLWRNTRLHFQIWTRKNLTILSNVDTQAVDAAAAKDFQLPIGMHFPMTITLDRHGKLNNQSLAGYEITGGTYQSGKAVVVKENFASQGTANITGSLIGGTGGCSCIWTNFAS